MRKGFILILLLILSLTGCSSKDKSTVDTDTVKEETNELPEIQPTADTGLETEPSRSDTTEETEEKPAAEELTTLTFAMPEGDTLVEKLTLDVPSKSELKAYYFTNMEKDYYSGEKVNQRMSVTEWMSSELGAIPYPPNGYTIGSNTADNIRIRAYPTAEQDKYIAEMLYAHENERTVNVIEDSGEENGFKYEYKYVESTQILEDGTVYNYTCYYTLNDELSLVYEILSGTDAANPEDIAKKIANEIKLK